MPTAIPSTAATIGVRVRASWRMKASAGEALNPSPARSPEDWPMKSARSLPALNMPGCPAKTTAPIRSEASASTRAARIASYMAPVSAFFFSGRFRVIRRTPPERSSIATGSAMIRSSNRQRQGGVVREGAARHDGLLQAAGLR